MTPDSLEAAQAAFPAWIIEHHPSSAGDYYSAVLPGRVVKASTLRTLRQRLAPEPDADYTARAVAAITEALAAGGDFPAWLAEVLATVAKSAGSPDALIAGRPASWEAPLVLRLAGGG
jgi:hypothetical protein